MVQGHPSSRSVIIRLLLTNRPSLQAIVGDELVSICRKYFHCRKSLLHTEVHAAVKLGLAKTIKALDSSLESFTENDTDLGVGIILTDDFDDMPELELIPLSDDENHVLRSSIEESVNMGRSVELLYYVSERVIKCHFLNNAVPYYPLFVYPIFADGWLIGVADVDGNPLNIKTSSRLMLGKFSLYDDDEALIAFLNGDLMLGLHGGAPRGKKSHKNEKRRQHKKDRNDRKRDDNSDHRSKRQRPSFKAHQNDCVPKIGLEQIMVLNGWRTMFTERGRLVSSCDRCKGVCPHTLGYIETGSICTSPISVTGDILTAEGRSQHVTCMRYDRTIIYWLDQNSFDQNQVMHFSVRNQLVLAHFGVKKPTRYTSYYHDRVIKNGNEYNLFGFVAPSVGSKQFFHDLNELQEIVEDAMDEQKIDTYEVNIMVPPLGRGKSQKRAIKGFVDCFSKIRWNDFSPTIVLCCYSTAIFNKITGSELGALPTRNPTEIPSQSPTMDDEDEKVDVEPNSSADVPPEATCHGQFGMSVPPPDTPAPEGTTHVFLNLPKNKAKLPAVNVMMLEHFFKGAQKNCVWWIGQNTKMIYIIYEGTMNDTRYHYTGWARPLFIDEIVTHQNSTDDGLISFHGQRRFGYLYWPEVNRRFLNIKRPVKFEHLEGLNDLVNIWDQLGFGEEVTIPIWGTPQQRLFNLGISLYWSAMNGQKHFDVVLLTAKIKAEYKRRYGATEWLDSELTAMLRDEPRKVCLFYSSVIESLQVEEKIWPMKAEAIVTSTAGHDGSTTQQIRNKSRSKWLKTLLGSVTIPTAIYTAFKNYNYISDMITDPQRTIAKEMVNNIDPVNKFTIRPLNKARLRKTKGEELTRPLLPVWSEVKLSFDSQLSLDKPEQYVDCFGTFTNCPVAYMNGDDDCIYQSLRARHAFERDIDDEISEKFYDSAIKNLKLMFDTITLSRKCAKKFLVSNYGQKRGIRLWRMLSEPLTVRDLRIEYFMKLEAYLGKDSSNAKCRPISNRSDKLVAHFGTDFNELGCLLAKKFSIHSKVFYATKCTPDMVGYFAQRMDDEMPFKYEADASSWDGSLPPIVSKVEKWFIANKIEGWQDDIGFLLDHWGSNFGTSKSKAIQYSCDHGRNSGDLHTSSFNSLINILITLWANDLSWDDDFLMMVLGDDNVVGLSKPIDEELIISRYEALGMTLELVTRDTMAEATFCSGRFWKVNGIYRWGSNPFRILSKLGLNHHNHKPQIWLRLLYGMALSLLPIAGHIPIVGALIRRIASLARELGLKPKYNFGDKNPYAINGGVVIWPGADTYAQFSQIYDIDLVTIFEIEEQFSQLSLSDFPLHLTGPVFDHGVFVDIGVECDVSPFEYESQSDEYLEEVDKLNSPFPLLKAWQHGNEEIALGGNWFAPLAHMILTVVSSMSLPMGVYLHEQFNQRAITPLNKGKLKKKKAKKKKRAERSAIRLAAEELGGLMGHHLMGRRDVGKGVMGQVLDYIGVGDFSPRTNSLVRTGIPTINSTAKSQNHHRYKATERVAELEGSTSSVFHYWRINPLNSALFPVLAGEAVRWEQYRFHGLMFYYGPQSGMVVNGTNPNLGYVAMCDQIDVADEKFESITKVMNYGNTGWSRTDKELIIGIECKSSDRPYEWYFCDDLNSDDRTTDFGRLTFMAAEQPGANPIGQLFVTYDIEFKGRKYLDVPRYIEYNMYNESGINANDPIGTESTRAVESNIGIWISDSGSGEGDIFNFPSDIEEGYFRLRYYCEGSSTTDVAITFTLTNASFADDWFSPDRSLSLHTIIDAGVSTHENLYHESVIKITDFDASIRLTSVTLPTSATYVNMNITQVYPPADFDTEIPVESLLRAHHEVYFRDIKHTPRTYGYRKPRLLDDEVKCAEDSVFIDYPVSYDHNNDYRQFLMQRLETIDPASADYIAIVKLIRDLD